MDAEIAKQWVERLKSGKDTKGAGGLSVIVKGAQQDCCMGVLCKMAIEAGVPVTVTKTQQKYNEEVTEIEYDGKDCYLPESVRKWASMKSKKGCFSHSGDEAESLVGVNDRNDNFGPVIEKIEQYAEIL